MTYVLLPNQLFDKKYLLDTSQVILYEHPHFFKDYNYNKKKIILHRASMKYYYDYLQKSKFKVKYIQFNKPFVIDPNKHLMFDPLIRLKRLKIDTNMILIESPNMLMSTELMEKHRKKTDKFFFNSFYMWTKKELNILPSVKSQDKANRKTLPKNLKLPSQPLVNTNKYVTEAVLYTEKHFPDNYGNVDNFIYPTTHGEAVKMLTTFIKTKFNKFGDYQDFIQTDNNYLFHSLLSSSLNIGLLNPSQVIQIIDKIKSSIPLNSYEGFIRQLFWREYQLYTYKYCNFKQNYFGNSKKLSKKWYNGSLGIPPVDDAIVSGFDTGYLHHIQRLMIVGNYMNLSQISPKQGFRWFMEFSCDSYEWVMEQNVYDMVFFVTGGQTMRRPYASSSNYVIKMSDYKKGDWSDTWDELYKTFIQRNKKKLYKFRYYFKGI